MAFQTPISINSTQTIKYKYPGDTPMAKATADFLKKGMRAELLNMAVEGVEVQAKKFGNPLNFAVVDGITGKPLVEVQRRAILRFGKTLPRQAMRDVERALLSAIGKKTKKKTGTLSSLSNWQWRMTTAGKNVDLNTVGKDIPFSSSSKLMLVPQKVPYATVTNRQVGKGNSVPGFMRAAAREASKSKSLIGFRVVVNITRKYAVPGEMNPYGTAYLAIKAGSRGRR